VRGMYVAGDMFIYMGNNIIRYPQIGVWIMWISIQISKLIYVSYHFNVIFIWVPPCKRITFMFALTKKVNLRGKNVV
jgi:hypothetical protein